MLFAGRGPGGRAGARGLQMIGWRQTARQLRWAAEKGAHNDSTEREEEEGDNEDGTKEKKRV